MFRLFNAQELNSYDANNNNQLNRKRKATFAENEQEDKLSRYEVPSTVVPSQFSLTLSEPPSFEAEKKEITNHLEMINQDPNLNAQENLQNLFLLPKRTSYKYVTAASSLGANLEKAGKFLRSIKFLRTFGIKAIKNADNIELHNPILYDFFIEELTRIKNSLQANPISTQTVHNNIELIQSPFSYNKSSELIKILLSQMADPGFKRGIENLWRLPKRSKKNKHVTNANANGADLKAAANFLKTLAQQKLDLGIYTFDLHSNMIKLSNAALYDSFIDLLDELKEVTKKELVADKKSASTYTDRPTPTLFPAQPSAAMYPPLPLIDEETKFPELIEEFSYEYFK